MYDRVLLATDGSDHAQTAARHAIELATCCSATLHIISVVETRTGYDSAIVEPEAVRENLTQACEAAVATAQERAVAAGVPTETVVDEGVPAACIASYVESAAIDLVVLGERGHSAFKTVLLGSTAESVLYDVDVPVTVV